MKFQDVKSAASGRWPEIVSALSSFDLRTALDVQGRKHVDCPVHGESSKKPFRVFKDFAETGGAVCSRCGNFADGFALLAWLNNVDAVEAKNQVEDYLGLSDRDAHNVVRSAPASKPEPKMPTANPTWARRLAQWWNEALPLTSPKSRPARSYFNRRGLRGITNWPEVLRMHPALDYFESDDKGSLTKLGTFPCILAAVIRPNGKIATLHRTYITAQGLKAPVPSAKKLCPAATDEPLGGVAIPLVKPGEVLGLAEGIETAMAVTLATGMPVWAAISDALLTQVAIPDGVRRVVLWSDKDQPSKSKPEGAGAYAASVMKDRLGAMLSVHMPPMVIPPGEKGIDWLDVLNQHGSGCFPSTTQAPTPDSNRAHPQRLFRRAS